MLLLRVITVPATGLDGEYHTAFTVCDGAAGDLRASAGWSLRDAITFFSEDFDVALEDIRIARPFVPQEIYLRER